MQSHPFFLVLVLLFAVVPLLIRARALPGKGHAPTTPRRSNKNQKRDSRYKNQKRDSRSSKRSSYLSSSASSSAKNTPISEFLKSLHERGYAAYQEAVARGSSTFESACIKATRPNDDPAKEKYVSAIVAAVNDFEEPKKRKQKTKASEEVFDPYQVALHKLWCRIGSKQDWRTKVKALYILLRLSQSVSIDHSTSLRIRMKRMKTQLCRKTGNHGYFNRKDAVKTMEKHPSTTLFLKSFSEYVLYRCQHFGPSFEEALVGYTFAGESTRLGVLEPSIKITEYEIKSKSLRKLLKKIRILITMILLFDFSNPTWKDMVNDITASCFSLLLNDLEQLITLYDARLKDLLDIYNYTMDASYSIESRSVTRDTPEIIDISTSSCPTTSSTLIDNTALHEHLELCRFHLDLLMNRIEIWTSLQQRAFREYDCKKMDLSSVLDNLSLTVEKLQTHCTQVETISAT